VDFDRLSVCFLTTRTDSPDRSASETDAIQDAHMAHLADLHEDGHLLAAGPVADRHYRGLLLFRADVEESEQMMLADPAVRAGWFDVKVVSWMVPGGALHFASTTFPRSMAEVD
jgi:uncharacterized protein YciI